MRFYAAKYYAGIIDARPRTYASYNAVLDGRFEAWTLKGKPYSTHDADRWVELPDDPTERAQAFLTIVGNTPVRETSRVIICTDVLAAILRGADLITCNPEKRFR